MSEDLGGVRRMPVRLSERIELPEPYAGWWVVFRLNVPMRVVELVDAKELAKIYAGLAQICRDSNFVDDEGVAVDVTQPEDWPRLGADMVIQCIELFKGALRRPFVASSTSSPPASEATADEPPKATA